MTLADLQAELETVPYDARVKRMIALGRQAENAPLLDEMETGAHDLRWLALQSCFGSRDGTRALRMLHDSSQMIRRCALGLLAEIGTTAQIVQMLETILPKHRRHLLFRLYKRKRQEAIDACLQTLAAQDDPGLANVLPFGVPPTVRAFLPRVLDRFLPHHWVRLARFHPDIALETLQAQAEAADRPDAGLVYRANSILPFTTETRPQDTFALVQILLRHITLNSLHIEELAARLPVEMADLVLGTDTAPSLPLRRVLPRLNAERIIALVERYYADDGTFSRRQADFQRNYAYGWNTDDSLDAWYKRLAPALRDEIFGHFARGWQDRQGRVPASIVALLSRDLREQEGRRNLLLPALAARPAERLPYAAYVPWNEALQTLDPFLRNPDPALRIVAHATLADAARYHRDRLAELLAIHIARKNEQDPIRLVMLNGLAELPPGCWKPEHLDDLSQIFRNALDAADLSHSTAGAMEQLIARLLPFYPHWCADWMATMARERGTIALYGLQDRLSDADVRTLAPILLPVFHAWENREGWQRIVYVASSLGRRLRVFDELTAILERIVLTSAAQYLSSSALSLLAQRRYDRLADLIPRLIASDPSWATQSVVYEYLHRKRQDLLTPFLGFRAYAGRFSTGKTRFVLPLSDGFVRWTARQQQIFADVLGEVTRDTGRDTPSILTVIAQLAALPAVPPARLTELAGLESKPAAARDAALRALGSLDGGQGVAVLLDAMSDDRSRIAIYALRRTLLETPAARALQMLRGVPTTKVTVAKEVIRLLGELKSEAAYAELRVLEQRDLHRDARVALLRAFWDYLDRPEVWDILERAAQSPDAAIAAHVSRIPAEGLTQTAQERLIHTLSLLLTHPDPKVRLDTLTRCGTLPVTDRDHVLLPLFLQSVGSPVADERQAGAEAVFMTYTGRDAGLVAQTTRQLLSNRRALAALTGVLVQKLEANRARLLPTARAVLDVLQTDPLTSQWQIRLAMQALPLAELTALLQGMADTRELHADALTAAMQALASVTPIRKDVSLEELEAALAASEDRYLRRLALAALVKQAQGPTGWTDARLARLNAFCSDSAALVAEAAQFTFPPEQI